MGAASRQLYLDFDDAAEHFRILHGRHQHDVAVCTKGDGRDSWTERVYSHDDASAMLVQLAACNDLNVYQSQNGFSGRRLHDCLRVLNAAYVDLDTYNVAGLEGVRADELLDRVLAAHPWFPVPTLLFNSGRGAYFEWLFSKPLATAYLPRWQAVTDALIALLEPFGADPACRDAERVLRAAGSTHLVAQQVVTGLRVGPAVEFELFERTVLANALPAARPSAGLRLVSNPDYVPKRSTASPARRAQYLRSYQLAHDRMHDCETLAGLRGSPRMVDCRHRLLYVYAVSGAWYWSGTEQAEQELRYFAERHFLEAKRYRAASVRTVLNRMADGKSGVARIAGGVRVDPRYKLRNDRIIAVLGVSAAEQTAMRTIIGPAERTRRLTQRRRAAGMESREDYLDKAAARRQRAAELRQAGLSQKAIAGELGVTQQAVSHMLRSKP